MVAELLSLCPTAREPGRGIGSTHQPVGKTEFQEKPEADSSDDGRADRLTLNGKGTAALSFNVISIY